LGQNEEGGILDRWRGVDRKGKSRVEQMTSKPVEAKEEGDEKI